MMKEYKQETDDECVRCCLDIFKDFTEVEAASLSASVLLAWTAGRQVCEEMDDCDEY